MNFLKLFTLIINVLGIWASEPEWTERRNSVATTSKMLQGDIHNYRDTFKQARFKEESDTVFRKCSNDGLFHHFYEGRNRSCKQIRFLEESDRVAICQEEVVRSACPQSCGSCCEDSQLFTFLSRYGSERRCEWLKGAEKRKKEYCGQFLNGYIVRDRCPVACEFCFSTTFTSKYGVRTDYI